MKIAEFDKNGEVVKLNIDWKDFEVSFKDYFNGNKDFTSTEWEKVFFYVNNLLTDDYIIASLSDRYKVEKKQTSEPYIPTNEEQRENRKIAYAGEVDCITAHIQRLRDVEQTQKIIEEINALIVERDEKVQEIKERYPYSGEEQC
jgi:hypothetical protein